MFSQVLGRSTASELHDDLPLNRRPELLVCPVRALLLWQRLGGGLGKCRIAIKGSLSDTERETCRDDCEVSLCCGCHQLVVRHPFG
jgi:hypothetical protein